MSDNDPIIRASDLRRVLAKMRTPYVGSANPVLLDDVDRALAAVPQREEARPCADHHSDKSECPMCVPAAPHQGEPPVTLSERNMSAWVDYARHWRERADALQARYERQAVTLDCTEQQLARAEAEAERLKGIEDFWCGEGYEQLDAVRARLRENAARAEAAEAELAKLREQEPVMRVATHENGGTSLDWLGEKSFMSCDLSGGPLARALRRILGPLSERLLYAAPVPPADHAQALREARAEVWREAARIAELAGFSVLERAFAAKAREVSK